MKKLILSFGVIILVAGAAIAATSAYFSSQDVLGTNTLSSGTLTLDLSNGATKIVGLGDVIGMVPGDVALPAEITVNNVGSEDFAWVGKFILTGDSRLPEVIYIKDMQMEFLAPEDGTWTEATDHFIKDGRGFGLYGSYYSTLADLDPLHVITLKVWNEHYAGMIPPYPFFEGALRPGYQYRLTFTLAMHPSAGNTYKNRTMGLQFQANATQLNADAIAEMISGLVGTTYPASSVDMTWLNNQITNQH